MLVWFRRATVAVLASLSLISASFADNMKAQRPVAAAGEAQRGRRSLKKLIV